MEQKAQTREDASKRHLPLELYRYAQLVEMGIVNNRVTLRRWIKAGRFPKPVQISNLIIAWRRQDLESWLNRLAPRGVGLADPRSRDNPPGPSDK